MMTLTIFSTAITLDQILLILAGNLSLNHDFTIDLFLEHTTIEVDSVNDNENYSNNEEYFNDLCSIFFYSLYPNLFINPISKREIQDLPVITHLGSNPYMIKNGMEKEYVMIYYVQFQGRKERNDIFMDIFNKIHDDTNLVYGLEQKMVIYDSLLSLDYNNMP